jgi:glycosyltransferase involved in cell wall biosynthesis
VGILHQMEPERHGFRSVHVWSFDTMLERLPERRWLVKHSTGPWQGSLSAEMFWERFLLSGLARQANVDLMFNVDSGSTCRFRPAVTMSQDMLPFEPGEMQRYAGKARARLVALRHIHISALRHAAGAVFLTRYAAEMIQRACGELSNMAIVPHGIDERFRAVKRRDPWPRPGERPIRCLYVSNTAPYKHQWHVVDAIARLRAAGQPIELHLVGGGKGPAQAQLLARVRDADPERHFVKLFDFVPHREIPALLAEADVFLFASSCENMPVTLLEAMASGLPIACSERGPMPEVLQDGGRYFDPEEPASIAAAIDLLLGNSTQRSNLAERAREIARRYSWRRCADETFAFISETFQRSQLGATA